MKVNLDQKIEVTDLDPVVDLTTSSDPGSVDLVKPKRNYRRVDPLYNPRNQRVKLKDKNVLELAIKGVTETQIAKITGVSQSTVNRKIKEFAKVFTELERINDYKDLKTDLLSAAELAALKSSLDPKNLDNTSMLNGAKAFDIFNKANRLEQGLSTDNQALKIFGKIGVTLS